MKYLGSITNNKDIATKGYVDTQVGKPRYSQSITTASSGSLWYLRIDYDSSYTPEQLLNAYAYFVRSDGSTMASAPVLYVQKVSTTYYYIYFRFESGSTSYYPASGDTLYVYNDCTDTGSIYVTK